MKKLLPLIGIFAFAGNVHLAEPNLAPVNKGSTLISPQMIEAIPAWRNYGELFLYLQTHWVKLLFLIILIAVPTVFLLHYLIIGPKKFSHEGRKFLVFPSWQRIIHWIAALGFVLIIPTGIMIIYAKLFGGGTPVRFARYLHDIGAVLFGIAVIPMFLMWLKEMLPRLWDIKWFMILGGYLSKEKKEIPAAKFNAGQKMWYWIATLGGIVMIITGAMMYFQDFDIALLNSLNLYQIDLLRLAVITHLFLAMLIVAFFLTHVYMSVFAIKGSLDSMIDGCKSEDELKYLHSVFYKKIIKEGKDKELAEKC
ncbi:formate dehydrogenase subunit C [Nautilia profundicola AmH]|uniref:Formate dehydrogenase subunit C n=1 Tax=Nautilia profundicola (strain ATCC BAA-1463 / DSM 18972 / AmH) TaxID=598659 RepID=B9L5R4_NAUPA|nr:formate dehydrogenase subunit gamma [Nautilia profundicola]ACM92956.1 formate dehydrogenase subunit C [Nautilia profundicola AmH]